MNDTHSSKGFQVSPPEKAKFFQHLFDDLLKKIEEKTKERLEHAETELWLYLRKAVIHGFREYGDLENDDTIHLLSNVLLNMDDVFKRVQEQRDA